MKNEKTLKTITKHFDSVKADGSIVTLGLSNLIDIDGMTRENIWDIIK